MQHTPSANNGEQHKDNKHNNNNIANYFKPNKHIQLDLAKKNNENLVEVLICNAIDKAADLFQSQIINAFIIKIQL